jgi:transcriptional regulator with XRE-family HTH domain
MPFYLHVPGLGKIVREERLKLGMTVDEFAKHVCATSQQVSDLEAGKSTGSGIQAYLGKSSESFNINLFLSVADAGKEATLFNLDVRQAQAKAYYLNCRRNLTDSYFVVQDVMNQIAREHELASDERSLAAMAYRDREKSLEIDEDKLRDMVKKAQRRLEK